MALVAYDNSDSSEYEDEGESDTIVTLKEASVLKPSVSKQEDEDTPDDHSSIFNHLPQPSSKKPTVFEEDDEFLHKKEKEPNIQKPKAKITVPSLSDFKDVESAASNAKPRVANGKKSGLLSILPQPKNAVTTTTRSLIPHVLTQKPNPTVKKKEPLPKPQIVAAPKLAEYSDDSDDDNVSSDFFSINKPVEPLPIHKEPLDIDKPTIGEEINHVQPKTIESYFKQDVAGGHQSYEQDVDMGVAQYDASEVPSSSNSYAAAEFTGDAALDEEAILKLCGTRGKRKRENIQIVDVNQQEVLSDAREWLLKGLMDDTSKRVSASKKKGNEPTSQQKRKHQITYLAHQAKANEAELQNQWASNRMSKRQTQSKYGF